MNVATLFAWLLPLLAGSMLYLAASPARPRRTRPRPPPGDEPPDPRECATAPRASPAARTASAARRHDHNQPRIDCFTASTVQTANNRRIHRPDESRFRRTADTRSSPRQTTGHPSRT